MVQHRQRCFGSKDRVSRGRTAAAGDEYVTLKVMLPESP